MNNSLLGKQQRIKAAVKRRRQMKERRRQSLSNFFKVFILATGTWGLASTFYWDVQQLPSNLDLTLFPNILSQPHSLLLGVRQ